MTGRAGPDTFDPVTGKRSRRYQMSLFMDVHNIEGRVATDDVADATVTTRALRPSTCSVSLIGSPHAPTTLARPTPVRTIPLTVPSVASTSPSDPTGAMGSVFTRP
jgi:hypothetical protein